MPNSNGGDSTTGATGGADILSVLQGYINTNTQSSNTNTALLQSIDQTTKQILQRGGMSMSNAQNAMPGYRSSSSTYFQDRSTLRRGNSGGSSFSQFTDEFERALLDELVGREFKQQLSEIRSKLARDLGVSVEEVPKAIAKGLASKAAEKLKNNPLVANGLNQAKGFVSGKLTTMRNAYVQGRNGWVGPNGERFDLTRTSQTLAGAMNGNGPHNASGGPSVSNIANKSQYTIEAQTVIIHAAKVSQGPAAGGDSQLADNLQDVVSDNLPDVDNLADMSQSAANAAPVIEGLKAAMASVGVTAGTVAVALGAVAIAVVAVTLIIKALGPAIEGAKKMFEQMKRSANRYEESREKNLKLAQERAEADIKVMIEQPFKILEAAAQNLYDAWDNNIRIINGTQGYNKDQLSDLMGAFAERLRQEGLTKVVSTADITTNLTKVLEAGLSGAVAEEFAYLATKLNAAIPTEDFFGYAGTYSSIAAQAIQNGASQADAIAYANSQLEAFASNLLYASREVAGGFTTGLKDAQNLFAQSVQISQAARTNNSTQISGVTTAIASIVGAVAPDLASSMTDAIYKAATGGNSSEIVALRSLAGINASNTEFLKQLANDPQSVFSELFDNLGSMQKMSEDNYMEVAEGLSSIFGIDSAAFARVDFNYLAQAIRAMNTSNTSLLENIEHLASGETTTNAEQLKMQQINEYMIEEGLAYVLDNEAARSIQENMWAEQRQRELLEATYAVELKGSALEFLEGIRKTIDNILSFLNPFKWIGKLVNLAGTAAEAAAQEADVRQLLELGRVGSGNAQSLYQLTTRNANLNVTESLLSQMGGVSLYEGASTLRNIGYNLMTPWNAGFDLTAGGQGLNALLALGSSGASHAGRAVSSIFSGKSAYSWGTIGKSTANALLSASGISNAKAGGGLASIAAAAEQTSATAQAQQAATGNLTAMLDTIQPFVDEAIKANEAADYDTWVQSASRHGITDFAAALESAGLSEDDIKAQFDQATTAAAQAAEADRKKKELEFWEDNIELLTSNNTLLQSIFDKQSEFFQSMVDYFINHLVYSDAYSHTDVTAVQKKEKEKSETAVYALAQALTQNTTDLLDPTVQTNVLLAQILKLVNMLVQQGALNSSSDSGNSMASILANMATGNWEIQV